MSNEKERKPTPDPDSPIQRIEIETEGSVDWSTALKELETAEPAEMEKPPAPPPAAGAEESAASAKPGYIPRPPRKAPVIPEGTPPADELSEVLTSVNSALNQLKRFESAHKHVIAPNIFRVWEDGLREAATVMTREYRRLREETSASDQPEQPAEDDHAVGEEQ